jgi:hypothetical protein
VGVDKSNESGLLRVIIWGTALAGGAMVASLQALQAGPNGFYFEISWATALAFAAGAAAVLAGWRILLQDAPTPRGRLLRAGVKWVLLLSAAAAFLYPLRFVPRAKLPEIATGLGLAALVLSIVGWLLWTIRRFLEKDEE